MMDAAVMTGTNRAFKARQTFLAALIREGVRRSHFDIAFPQFFDMVETDSVTPHRFERFACPSGWIFLRAFEFSFLQRCQAPSSFIANPLEVSHFDNAHPTRDVKMKDPLARLKEQMMKISVPLLIAGLLFLASFSPAQAESKTFIKEYTYQASEFDSKASSRTIAREQVKRLLLEELGTYLESSTEVKNYALSKDKITALTAGLVQTRILEEKWDGKTFWLKAEIKADPENITTSINALRSDRKKSEELEEIRNRSDEALKQIEKLKGEIDLLKKDRSAQKEFGRSIETLNQQTVYLGLVHYREAPKDFTVLIPDRFSKVEISCYHKGDEAPNRYCGWNGWMKVNGQLVWKFERWTKQEGGVIADYTQGGREVREASGKGKYLDVTTFFKPGMNRVTYYHFNEGPGINVKVKIY